MRINFHFISFSIAVTILYFIYNSEIASDEIKIHTIAKKTIQWEDSAHEKNGWEIPLQLLTINDFHGQITAGVTVEGRPVGGASVLSAYLKAAQAQAKGTSFIIHGGDHVSASVPQSSLLQDEPSIMFFNMLGNTHCNRTNPHHPECNLLGIPGNHELDEGAKEMLRLINGGSHADGPFLEDPYRGAGFPYICANLIDNDKGQPIFAPYVIRMVQGVPIAFIGAVLRQAGVFLPPQHLDGFTILDEVESINRYAQLLQAQGIRTIIAVIHQGGYQPSQEETNTSQDQPIKGDIAPIIFNLDNEVDVVITGHTHTYHNALVDKATGGKRLVVQAWPYGTGYADIDLAINPASGDVVAMTSRIVTTWADEGPGVSPDQDVARLAEKAEAASNMRAAQVIATALRPITRESSPAGESALGNLIADAQRNAMGTDFAFMNSEGIQADIAPGDLTWGDHYQVQPHNLNLIKLDLTGRQIYEVLNQQWRSQAFGRLLQVSGLSYTWDAQRPAGDRVVEVKKDGVPIESDTVYTVTVNEYLAGGGGDFTALQQGANPVVGPFLLEALVHYVHALQQPLNADIEGRISRIN